MVLDQLANSRGAVDVRDDLEQKNWCRQGGADRVQVSTFVLVSDGDGGHLDRTIIERADQGVDLDTQAGIGEHFGKTPKARDQVAIGASSIKGTCNECKPLCGL